MKTIFRLMKAGAMTAVILAAGAIAGYGQDPAATCADVDGANAIYGEFTKTYSLKGMDARKKMIDLAKQFLEKYGACEAFAEQNKYFRDNLPTWERAYADLVKSVDRKMRFDRFDAAISKDNAAEMYAAGKEILAEQPDNFNIIVPLGIVGWVQALKNNNAHADDTLRFAKMALDGLKKGTAKATKKDKAGNDVYGALKWEYTRDQAISELTYSVGYLTYYVKKDKKGALPFYYELAQSGRYKDDPRVFATIGSYYVEEAAPIGDEIAKMINEIKTSTDEAKKAELDVKVKERIGLFNGYAERALDAFARAHKVAKADTPAEKTFKDGLYKQLEFLYEKRFEKKDGLDTYIASTLAKPMPNPTTPVTPITDPEPTTTTTTTSGATTASPSTTAPAAAKPASSTKPLSTNGNGTKTAVVKKGTRK